jgi:uncharacterized Zn ribbon protein
MLFRAVIYSIDHTIHILWINNTGNWFNFAGRSYRKDRDAVCQVLQKGDQIKGIVESLYIEGNPVPMRSTLDVKKITKEHWDEKIAEAGNKPQKGLLALIFKR